MSETVIRTQGLTKDYGHGRGVFGVDLAIRRGEVFGYVGTNGSGKTTTIRALMGFVRPTAGTASLLGRDCWSDAALNMESVSYVPGEVAFPDLRTGTEFLRSQARFLGVSDFSYMNHLIEALQLDPTAPLKRMSKGMKQKTAIVAALMGRREVLILDEPTTGLDPLMRDAFLDLVREEKDAGRTVFMSSHIFEEMEEVCDRVAMIRDGRILGIVDLAELRRSSHRTYTIDFGNALDAHTFAERMPEARMTAETGCGAAIEAPQTACLFAALAGLDVRALSERQTTLEDLFLKAYEQQGAE